MSLEGGVLGGGGSLEGVGVLGLGLLEKLCFGHFPLGGGGVFGLGLLEKLRIGHFPLGGGGVLGLGPLKKDLSTYFWEGGSVDKELPRNTLEEQGGPSTKDTPNKLGGGSLEGGSCDGEIPRKS